MSEKITAQTGNNIPDWIVILFRNIDAMDVDAFVEYLTADAVCVYGSGTPVTGKENIKNFLGAFYGNLNEIKHLITGVWEIGEALFVQTRCTYTMKDDRVITIPAMNLFHMEGDLVKEYLIYADPSPMMAA